MIRLGLCCQFAAVPIRFRRATATALGRLTAAERRRRLAELVRHNADALAAALAYCAAHGIGAFRINSQILPLRTHPEVGYQVGDLPGADDLLARFGACRRLAAQHGLRLSFHPDQFVVLSSPDPQVTARSIAELEYQAEVADWVGADVINVHGGGAYGEPTAALGRLARTIAGLSPGVRRRLTLENDDRVYTPQDLLPVCQSTGIPLVYDVHHHRCRRDGLSEAEATAAARATWNGREPLVHISSPRGGWQTAAPQYHDDAIDSRDFPSAWESATLTVEVEAKAKEVAIARLATDLRRRGVPLWPGAAAAGEAPA